MSQDLNAYRVGVIGDGSWGTAIMKMLSENLEKINWWVKDDSVKQYIETHSHSPKHLSSIKFNLNQLNITADINELVNQSDIIIFVVPSVYIKSCLDKLTVSLENKICFSAVKGIIPEKLLTVIEYLNQEYNVPFENLGNIMGPCHAEEVALQRLSYLTISAYDIEKAKQIQQYLNCGYIKTTHSNDVMGTEYASLLKNIYAIACGISHGLRYGDNYQAVLISNCARQTEYFLTKLIPIENRQINNSVYLGDLLVTGYSNFSRNRTLGNMIGKGYTVRSAMMEMSMVTEGYYATKGIYHLIKKYNLNMPICETIYKILYEDGDANGLFKKLSASLS